MAKSRRQSNDNLTLSINATSCVGDVISSTLTEAQFQTLRGTGWILADGRNIAGSALANLTGTTTAPDLRGMFLRGKNNGRVDGNQDPGGERPLGNYQADAFASHNHQQTTSIAAGGINSVGVGAHGRATTSADGLNFTLNSGGNETRPRNVAVNFYVRIN